MIDIVALENELKKRWPYPDHWYRKQDDTWDRATRFIYKCPTYEVFLERLKQAHSQLTFDKKELFYYALNRWYNFWSARGVESIFAQQPGVCAHYNRHDKFVDFTIHNIHFDHKTTRFPKTYGRSLAFAKNNKEHFIKWLYTHQSVHQRKHYNNRLFIVVYDTKGEHYKLKAELSWLRNLIEEYVSTFAVSHLIPLRFNNKEALSDIIWAIR